jgi:hypothetical protein
MFQIVWPMEGPPRGQSSKFDPLNTNEWPLMADLVRRRVAVIAKPGFAASMAIPVHRNSLPILLLPRSWSKVDAASGTAGLRSVTYSG